MSRDDFTTILAYLSAGIGKSISAEQAEVYYDLLGDVPLDLLELAVRQALLETRFSCLPTPGTLRQIALEMVSTRPECAAAAWELVRRAIARYGYGRESEALQSLPEDVAAAVQALGWRSLCDSTKPEISRAQFCQAFDSLSARRTRRQLLPQKYARRLDQLLPPALPVKPALSLLQWSPDDDAEAL